MGQHDLQANYEKYVDARQDQAETKQAIHACTQQHSAEQFSEESHLLVLYNVCM